MDAILLLLLFGCVWAAVAFGVGPIVGRTLSHKSRFDPQDREQLGVLDQYTAERKARVARAMERHNGRQT